MISKRDIYLIIAVLAINVIVGWHFYDVGHRDTVIKSMQDSLVTVTKEKKTIANQRDSIGKELVIANARSIKTRIVYYHDSINTKIHGDSAFDSTGKFIQVLDPRITQRIRSADTHITSLEAELKTAKYGLKIDTVFIAKTEEQSRLNQSIANQVRGSRFSRGFQAGIGYCRTPTKGEACVYLGYGFSARF